MFFWITSQEAEEEAADDGPDHDDDEQTAGDAERARRRDVIAGMGYANVVFYFIVLANAATLGARHIKITTAAQAARALAPIVGRFDTVLFAVGLIGAGLIAVPVLAGSAAYPLAEFFNWKEGLDNPLRRAPGFYAVIGAAVAVGIGGNFLGVDPVQGLVSRCRAPGVPGAAPDRPADRDRKRCQRDGTTPQRLVRHHFRLHRGGRHGRRRHHPCRRHPLRLRRTDGGQLRR